MAALNFLLESCKAERLIVAVIGKLRVDANNQSAHRQCDLPTAGVAVCRPAS